MYIEIILADRNFKIINKIHRDGNVRYLVKGANNQEFPYLSDVEIDDHSVLNYKDMDGLIKELTQVEADINEQEDIKHIEEIISLAEECRNNPNTILIFEGLVSMPIGPIKEPNLQK